MFEVGGKDTNLLFLLPFKNKDEFQADFFI